MDLQSQTPAAGATSSHYSVALNVLLLRLGIQDVYKKNILFSSIFQKTHYFLDPHQVQGRVGVGYCFRKLACFYPYAGTIPAIRNCSLTVSHRKYCDQELRIQRYGQLGLCAISRLVVVSDRKSHITIQHKSRCS